MVDKIRCPIVSYLPFEMYIYIYIFFFLIFIVKFWIEMQVYFTLKQVLL